MARASGANAASTTRRFGQGLRILAALLVIGALSVTTAAILATRSASPAQVASATATAAPAGAVVGVGTVGPRRDVPDSPVATDVPPGHGGFVPGCPGNVAGVPLAKVVHHGSRTAKVVALTFDDGYDGPNTIRILAILQKAKVNATFFPIGVAIKEEQAAWKAVALAGYPIANHTYDHKNLDGMCEASQLAELARQQAVVAKVLGVTTQPYMRPPGGNYDIVTRLAAARDGEQAVVLWDVDTRDWDGLSKRGITARAIVGTNGSIVILHTFVHNTANALPAIIASYRARGFTFVTVGQLLEIDGPVPFP
ncbi:MAG: peptidoglycan-N-acetylglucosamine deacetylase [Chloroflexota bacterium]|jgi:peptidoglycan/xylan/chitin deacetylase (PgdA/CDA1 family)|nr:peptidoglycan-N-acetylglucosamine deacetylase [Chloroflexota bacterium]